jgi:hypothetical protein
LVAATRNADGPTQVRFYFGLLWDLATFISTPGQENAVGALQGR